MRRPVGIALTVAVLLGVGALAVGLGAAPFVSRRIEARLERETGYRWTVALGVGATLRPEPGLVLRDVDARVELERGASARIRLPTARLFGSLRDWGETVHLERVELERPTLELPRDLWRYRRTRAPDLAQRPEGAGGPSRVSVRGASVLLTADGAQPRQAVGDLDVEAVAEPRTGALSIKAQGRVGGEAVRSDLVIAAAPGPGGAPASARFTVEAPGLLASPLTGSAEAAVEGAIVTLSRLSGGVGPNRFNGALVLDLTAKPAIRLDLGLPLLALGTDAGAASPAARWALTPGGLDAVRDFDARLKLYVGTLQAGALTMSELAGQAQLKDGAATLTLVRGSAYGGEVQGSVTLTPASPAPAHAVHVRVKDARALPFLAGVADFTLLDGTVSAGLDLSGAGWTSADLVRTLTGDAEIEARQGRINSVNLSLLAQMLPNRAPAGSDSGSAAGTTAFDRFSARFRLEGGRATTGDMALRGPIVEATGSGSVDLVGRTLDFRIHPRLVAAGTSPVGAMVAGLSIPVVVEGPWDSPRAFPDFGGRSAPPGSAPAPDPLGALLGKGGLGALLDAIVPNTGPQRDCGRNCPKADEGPFGPRRPGTGPSGQP